MRSHRSASGTVEFVEALESRVLLSRIPGIDVSHWQGSINWLSVANAGKKFAFAKATESTNFVDSRVAGNVAGGRAAGVLMGVYHFARPSTATGDATAEANWFVDQAGQYMTPGHLPPVLDLEDGGPTMTTTQLSNWVHEFQNRVIARTGVTPIIYVNTNYATNELNSSVSIYPLWIANWSTAYGDPMTTGSPPTGVWGAGNWKFWQYSSTGTVAGISGNVDLDVFKGTQADLEAMVIPHPDQIPPVVEDSQFHYATAPHRISFRFSEDVSASLQANDLVVRDITTQASVIVSGVSWNTASLTATFTLNNLLPDGRYQATLSGTGVQDAAGNPLGDDHVFELFFLAGDADHNGVVNLNDFNVLAANFGQSGRDFTQGDFNYDGTVNLADFNLLASNFGKDLNAPPAAAAPAPGTSVGSSAESGPMSKRIASGPLARSFASSSTPSPHRVLPPAGDPLLDLEPSSHLDWIA